MNKQDFIDRLRLTLSGRLTAEQVQEHVDYYEDYINTQVRLGYREEDVLRNLGEPRLIAKTIIETSGRNPIDYENGSYQADGYRNTKYQNTDVLNKRRLFRMPRWLWILFIVLVLILILSVVFTVLSAFAPLIFVMVIVVSLMKLFDWLN